MDMAGELESSIIITACRRLAPAPITMGVSGNGTEVADWKGSERNVEGKIWVWAGLWWAFLLYVIGLEEVEEKGMKVPTLLRAKICWILSSNVSRRATSGFGQAPSGSSHAVEGGGMTIGRVMDWTEARVDAIKTREEEEDEDEEREKGKERAGGSRPSGSTAARVVRVVSKSEGQKSAPMAPT